MNRVSRAFRVGGILAALAAVAALGFTQANANIVWGGTTGDVIPPIKLYSDVAKAVQEELNTTSYSLTSAYNPVVYGDLNSLKVVNVAGTPYVLISNSAGVFASPQLDETLNAEVADPSNTIEVDKVYEYGQQRDGSTYIKLKVNKVESNGTRSARNIVWGGTTGDVIPPIKLVGVIAETSESRSRDFE